MVRHSFTPIVVYQILALFIIFIGVNSTPLLTQKRGICATEDPDPVFLDAVANVRHDESNPSKDTESRNGPIEIETWFHIVSSKAEEYQVTDDMINQQVHTTEEIQITSFYHCLLITALPPAINSPNIIPRRRNNVPSPRRNKTRQRQLGPRQRRHRHEKSPSKRNLQNPKRLFPNKSPSSTRPIRPNLLILQSKQRSLRQRLRILHPSRPKYKLHKSSIKLRERRM